MKNNLMKKYKLTEEQIKTFNWLKQQSLNTDENTLCYWCKKYNCRRIVEVVQFAKARLQSGQTIRNIGGWINKLLISGLAVVNDECKNNRGIAETFAKTNNWSDLKIYEKYIKDDVTGDDLPLTMPQKDFLRAIEVLYHKSQIYKSL